MDDWVKLHRKALGSEIFTDSLWRVACWCLLKAHAQTRRERGLDLQPGQFRFRKREAAEELGLAPSTFWDRMQKLQELSFADQVSDQFGTTVTIVNWKVYQSDDGATPTTSPTARRPRADRAPTTSRPPTDHDAQQPTIDEQAERLYDAYPKKKSRKTALNAIRTALKSTSFDVLLEAVQAFTKATAGANKQFIPYPASWFNAEAWLDDRREWDRLGRDPVPTNGLGETGRFEPQNKKFNF